MDIASRYDQKLIPAEQAVSYLQNNSNLILGMGVAMPPALVQSVARSLADGRLNNLNLYYMHGTRTLKDCLLTPDLANKVHPHPLFLSAHDRQALSDLKAEAVRQVVPATFHQVGRILTEQVKPHCFMVTVSPMDKHGYFSLGTNADYGATVIRKAHRVIVEVNSQMPRTFGETSVHISDIDAIIENHTPLQEFSPRKPSSTDRKIAEQIIQHINDGDTLQVGIGGMPNAVLEGLHNHRNLGLHSELFSPAMVRLIQSGVLNGRNKTWMQHRHVFTLALGDRHMYDFMDDNPSIMGYPASWVNNPNIIRKNHNMVSVNAALEIDLTGQINAEQLNGQPFSGTGGQLDFVRGAYDAPGGRSFIGLHSTAKGGSISRIVPRLKDGVVTDTRMDTHYVVTEFGMVNLKGLSLSQRASALINIAHPDFREELHRQATQLKLI